MQKSQVRSSVAQIACTVACDRGRGRMTPAPFLVGAAGQTDHGRASSDGTLLISGVPPGHGLDTDAVSWAFPPKGPPRGGHGEGQAIGFPNYTCSTLVTPQVAAALAQGILQYEKHHHHHGFQ